MVVLPDVLLLVEVLPFESLSVAFLPASEDAGSATASIGMRRNRITFMNALDEGGEGFLQQLNRDNLSLNGPTSTSFLLSSQ